MENVCKASPAHLPIAQSHNCCPTGGIGIPTRASGITKITTISRNQAKNKENWQDLTT